MNRKQKYYNLNVENKIARNIYISTCETKDRFDDNAKE